MRILVDEAEFRGICLDIPGEKSAIYMKGAAGDEVRGMNLARILRELRLRAAEVVCGGRTPGIERKSTGPVVDEHICLSCALADSIAKLIELGKAAVLANRAV